MMMFNPVVGVLLLVLLFAGYLAIAQSVCHNAANRRLIPAIMVVIFIMYLCGVSFVALLYVYYGNEPFVLYTAFLIFIAVALALVIRSCIRCRDTMQPLYVVFFLLYCALVAYVTLYIRVGTFERGMQMIPFARVSRALASHSFEYMEHDILNAAMFVPMGILIPLMNSRVFNRFSYAFLFGMISSTAIETIQMVSHLGVFDIDDIIANVFGAVVGYMVCSVFIRAGQMGRH